MQAAYMKNNLSRKRNFRSVETSQYGEMLTITSIFTIFSGFTVSIIFQSKSRNFLNLSKN